MNNALEYHRTGLRHTRMKKRFISVGIRVEALTSVKGVLLDFMLDLPGETHNSQTIKLLSLLKTKGHVVYMDR